MSVIIESGAFRGSKEQLAQTIAITTFNATFAGALNAVTKYSPTIAQATGKLRQGFARSVIDIVQKHSGQSEINLRWRDIGATLVSLVNYAEYHIDGRPYHPGDKFYADPNKVGTKPINSVEFMDTLEDEIQKELDIGLNAAGLEVVRS